MMVAVKQRGAEVVLECPDGPAQGGLGDKELVGRPKYGRWAPTRK